MLDASPAEAADPGLQDNAVAGAVRDSSMGPMADTVKSDAGSKGENFSCSRPELPLAEQVTEIASNWKKLNDSSRKI